MPRSAARAPSDSPPPLFRQDPMDGISFDLINLGLSQAETDSTEESTCDQSDSSQDTEYRPDTKLLTIPAEIRNIIYALTLDPETRQQILLIEACPPKKSLILTCRQIYMEARRIHNLAYQQYWTANHFVVDLTNYATRHLQRIDCLRTHDIQRIERLTIWSIKRYLFQGRRGYVQLQLTHLSGIWTRAAWYEDLIRPQNGWREANFIAVRRDAFNARPRGWCLQCNNAMACADALRNEVVPMTLKEQVLMIMVELDREVVGNRAPGV